MQSKNELKKQIYQEIKALHLKIRSLNDKLTRLETGSPEPFPIDEDYIPPYLRKKNASHTH